MGVSAPPIIAGNLDAANATCGQHDFADAGSKYPLRARSLSLATRGAIPLAR